MRRTWDRLNAEKLRLSAAGQTPPPGFLDEWNSVRAAFQAAEAQWDEAYRMGVVIVVNDDLADAAEARLDDAHEQVIASPGRLSARVRARWPPDRDAVW